MGSGARIIGAKEMRAKLARIRDKFKDRVAAALSIEAEIEITEIKRRTPVDKGPLRASVHQEGPTREGRTVTTRVVAGGPAAPYAIYVHEDLTAIHPVGQAKYIESVILESRAYMGARVARRIELTDVLLAG